MEPDAEQEQDTNSSPRIVFATAVLIIAILGALLGGLAYVVRSLKNVELTLLLNLKRDDKAENKY